MISKSEMSNVEMRPQIDQIDQIDFSQGFGYILLVVVVKKSFLKIA
jgi:hypothetical protein